MKHIFYLIFIILINNIFFSVEDTELNLRFKATFEEIPEHRISLFYTRQYIDKNKLIFNTGIDFTPISANAHLNIKYNFLNNILTIGCGYQGGIGWTILPYGIGIGMQSNVYDTNIISNVYAQENLRKSYYKFFINTDIELNFNLFSDFCFLLTTHQEIYYQYLRGAMHDNHTWIYENIPDRMKNLRYYGNYYFGIKTPLLLNDIGFLIETDLDIYHYNMSTIASGGWGSDWMQININFVQIWKLFENIYLKSGIVWRNDRLYQDGFGENLALWYRKIKSQNEFDYWHIYRVFFIISYYINLK